MSVEIILLAFLFLVALFSAFSLFFSGHQKVVTLEELLEREKNQTASDKTVTGMTEISRQLQLVNFPFGPLVFLVGLLIASVMSGFLALEFFPESLLIAMFVCLVQFAMTILSLREFAKSKRYKFEQSLADALDLLQTALRSGASPQLALQTVADASTGPIKSEFSQIASKLQNGLPVESCVARINDLYDSEVVKMFTQTLILRWSHGGDFSALIKSVSRIVRQRVDMQSKLRGQLSGTKYASILIAVFPYLVVPIFLSKDPAWLETLGTHPIGLQLLLGAIALQIFGFVWIRNIVRVV